MELRGGYIFSTTVCFKIAVFLLCNFLALLAPPWKLSLSSITLKENVGNTYNVFVERDEGDKELIGDDSAETLNNLIGLAGTASTAEPCSIK